MLTMGKKLNQLIIQKEATIKEAMRTIYHGAIKMAIVVDNNKFYGVVTDGDIRRGILDGKDIHNKVFDVTNTNAIAFSSSTPKDDLLSFLKKNPEIIGLPLVDNNKIKDFVMLSRDSSLIYFNKDKVPNSHLKRILVIGGAGYIGSVLTRELLSKGYHVAVLDNLLYGKESLLELLKHPFFQLIEGDTRHIEVITNAIENVDAVVHLAELVGDPACNLNPKTTQNVNYLATSLIASVCKHYQVNRFIYTSSCSVYGASDKLLTEDSLLNPQSLYARMKIEAENTLLGMADNNFSPTILRLGTVFGLSYRPRFDLVVNLLTVTAWKDKKLTIFGGNQWRPNIHVLDVSRAIISALEAPLEKIAGEIFNVGSNNLNLTLNQIGETIHSNIPDSKIIRNNNADNRDYKVDFSKIKKVLKFSTTKTLGDGIKEIIDAFKLGQIEDYSKDIYNNFNFLRNMEKESKTINTSSIQAIQ